MSQKIYFIAIHFFSNNVTSKLGVFNIFKADKINIKGTLQKRNFKVLVFKSRRSFWGHAWCHKKNILLTFKGFCMNFSLELKKNISSHSVTSKQPHKIVQILMRHPVYVEGQGISKWDSKQWELQTQSEIESKIQVGS